MKRRWQYIVFMVANWLPPFVVYKVTFQNLLAERYPPDADSISIPIGGAVFAAIFVSFLVHVGILLPARGAMRYVRAIPLILSGLLLTLFCISWLIPDHYWISAAYALPLSVMIFLGWRELARKDAIGHPRT